MSDREDARTRTPDIDLDPREMRKLFIEESDRI